MQLDSRHDRNAFSGSDSRSQNVVMIMILSTVEVPKCLNYYLMKRIRAPTR